MFENLPDDMSLYHYTDINALLNILQEDCIKLRATNIYHLNDSKEILEGKDAIGVILKEDPTKNVNFENCYITSFSEVYDSLPMWGMYAANGAGCVLEFELGKLRSAFTDIAKCHYGQAEIQEEVQTRERFSKCGPIVITQNGIEQIPEELYKKSILSDLCLQAKHYSFSYECEIRGIYKNIKDKDGARKLHPEYRFCRGELVDFVNVNIDKSALKGLFVGPLVNDKTISLLSEFIHNRRGYEIRIEKFDAPYRG